MINFKAGPALTLQQVNYVHPLGADQTVEAGQVVRVANVSGVLQVLVGASASPTPATDLLGFALNSSYQGDVIESGKVGVYALDGAGIVETDQTYPTSINYTNFPLGSKLTAYTDGTVRVAGSTDRVIGYVEGIRDLPGKPLTVTNPVTGLPFTIQGPVTFLAVKVVS
jgi:hypothetical protein